MSKQTLRFAILCTGTTLESWEANCVNTLLEVDELELVLVIIASEGSQARSSRERISAPNLFGLLSLFTKKKSKAMRLVCHEALFPGVPRLSCIVRTHNGSQYFTERDVKQIANLDIDTIIAFGPKNIRGGIINTAKHGVWFFHHGDESKYSDAAPCFWELRLDDPVSAASLQCIVDTAETRIVLYKGYYRTIDYSWSGNRDRVYFASANWPQYVLRRVLAGHWDISNKLEVGSRVYQLPSNWDCVVFLLRLLHNNTIRRLKRSFGREEWNLGVIRKDFAALLDSKKKRYSIKWLEKSTKAFFCADGFVATEGEYSHILYEKYSYAQRRGRIAYQTLDRNLVVTKKGVLFDDVEGHASYPFVFHHRDHWYCVPSIIADRAVTLYRAERLPDRWVKIREIISDFPSVDATVLYYDGLYWLFCTREDRETNTELYIFWAAALEGPWREHACNPVKCDMRSARPGGAPFIYDGALYRPAQDCSRTYGGRLALNRVLELTPSKFRETTEKWIEPDKTGYYKDGIHTLAEARDFFLVDAKRIVFSPEDFLFRLNRRLRK